VMPRSTDPSNTDPVVRTAGNLDDGTALAQEPPEKGTPAGLHDFVLVSEATDEELRQYQEQYVPEAEQDSLTRRELYQYGGHVLNTMLGGYEWRSILRTVAEHCSQGVERYTLVSLVFCDPESIVLRDLKSQQAYFDEQTGHAWDLHFVGYRCQKKRSLRPSQFGIPEWRFLAKEFVRIKAVVQSEHIRARHYTPFKTPAWAYSGRPEIVSFMAYGQYDKEFDEPRAHIDWPSLRAVPLVDANGAYIEYSLGEIVEDMSDWRDRDSEVLRHFAPGELPIAVPATSLAGALQTVASGLALGVAGNAVYELIKKVMGL
jgi:hypothetical protein